MEGKRLMARTSVMKRLLALLIPVMMLVALTEREGCGREITDMAGRRVTISHSVQRVWPAYPPIAYLLYALAPSLSIGWPGPLPASGGKYLHGAPRDLPVVGGWFGQRTPNLEVLAAARPDLALVWDQSLLVNPHMTEILQKLNIPVVAVKLFRMADYPETLVFLGDVLNRGERARTLATYIERTIVEMKAFSGSIQGEKKSVYYAIGPDGLTSDCDHMPFLDEAIELAGGRNAYHCERTDRMMGRKIDLERLLLYDPDVIITQDQTFFSRAFSDLRYKRLRAIKQGRVYMIPGVPFNWLNYPPSFMRALGVRWLAHTLYPELYKGDLPKEIERFFKLFFNVDVGEAEAGEIMRQPKTGR
ncbi:MAG: ABC transporter substrate-binding protein [Syntrophorhabdales bacterium]|jgi:iron complex transport system substrate-binding protein